MNNFYDPNNLLIILDIIVAFILGILSTWVTLQTTNSSNKSMTARIMYEKIYHPVFKLLEQDLYKSISLEKAIYYGSEILKVIHANPLYYYPSLRLYCERLVKSNHSNYQDNFMTVCWSIDKYLDKYSRIIGAPVRSTRYRLNTDQYDSKLKFSYLILANVVPHVAIIFLVAYILRRLNLL